MIKKALSVMIIASMILLSVACGTKEFAVNLNTCEKPPLQRRSLKRREYVTKKVLPFFDLGFSWVIPSAIGLVVGLIISARLKGDRSHESR